MEKLNLSLLFLLIAVFFLFGCAGKVPTSITDISMSGDVLIISPYQNGTGTFMFTKIE